MRSNQFLAQVKTAVIVIHRAHTHPGSAGRRRPSAPRHGSRRNRPVRLRQNGAMNASVTGDCSGKRACCIPASACWQSRAAPSRANQACAARNRCRACSR
ncbi:hypothetical protein G6F24_017064 [Rhizopus arrhizus]|nr:hypothetical protein G6F24_017064 [Rhizopus arrhizus]